MRPEVSGYDVFPMKRGRRHYPSLDTGQFSGEFSDTDHFDLWRNRIPIGAGVNHECALVRLGAAAHNLESSLHFIHNVDNLQG
jgi:hypothetical protein